MDVLLVGGRDVPRDVVDRVLGREELVQVLDALLELGEELRLARSAFFVLRRQSQLGSSRRENDVP